MAEQTKHAVIVPVLTEPLANVFMFAAQVRAASIAAPRLDGGFFQILASTLLHSGPRYALRQADKAIAVDENIAVGLGEFFNCVKQDDYRLAHGMARRIERLRRKGRMPPSR